MIDEREKNLPRWAQELIKRLRHQLDTALEPAVDARRKLDASKKQNIKLGAILDAIHELLFSASNGGHKTSQEIIAVLEDYEIFPPVKDGEPADLPGEEEERTAEAERLDVRAERRRFNQPKEV